MQTQFWIQKAWGDSVDNATMKDIRAAIQETIEMDDEHGAFWAGPDDEENILEVHKNMDVFFILDDTIQTNLKARFSSWEEIEELYKEFLNSSFEKVMQLIRNKMEGV